MSFIIQPGVSAEAISGGAIVTTSATSITLTIGSDRVQNISMTASGQSVILPNATLLSEGGPLFIIKNTGSNSFALRDNASGFLVTIYPDQIYYLYLMDKTTAAGTWRYDGPIAEIVAGGAITSTSATSLTLVANSDRVQNIAMTASGQSLILPNATLLNEGGPLFVVKNTGGNSFELRDSTSTLLVDILPNEIYYLYLMDKTTAAGTWRYDGPIVSGAFPATANGAIAANDLIMINSDGTVSVVSTTPTSITGASTFEGVVGAFDSVNNKVLIFWKQNTTNGLYAAVGTVAGNGISFGSAVQIVSGNANVYDIAFDANAGKFVACYQDPSSVNQGVVLTVSGTSVSAGSPSQIFANANVIDISAVYDASAQKTLIIGRDVTNSSFGTARVATISGTSLSFGTEVVFNSATTVNTSGCYVPASSKCVVNMNSGGGNGRGFVATISGTSVSFGSALNWFTGSPQATLSVYDSVNTKVLCVYHDGSTLIRGNVQTVTGTTLTSGTNTTIVSHPASNFMSGAFDASTGKVLVQYNNSFGSYRAIPVTVSGTSLTPGTATVLDSSGAVARETSTVYDPINQKLVLSYAAPNTSISNLVGLINSTPQLVSFSLTANNFAGFAASAAANGATAIINMIGNIATLSGLTPGQKYYALSNNTVSTTPGSPSIYAGLAYSTTKLIIKG